MNLRLAGGGAVGQDLNTSSATQYHALGTKAYDRAGATYRYVQAASGAALVAGNVIQASASLTNHNRCVSAAAAIGDTTLTVTLGATAAAANWYADGWAVTGVTPGHGYKYLIKSHPAALSAATLTLTLAPDTPIVVALTTDTRVTLVANPWKNVIQSPITTLTGQVVGAAQYIIAASEFGWVGCGGPQVTLIGGTPAAGTTVVAPGTSAGMAVVDGAAAATMHLGQMMNVGAAAEDNLVMWTLDR